MQFEHVRTRFLENLSDCKPKGASELRGIDAVRRREKFGPKIFDLSFLSGFGDLLVLILLQGIKRLYQFFC